MPSKLNLLCLAAGLALALDALPGCSRVIGLGGEYYVALEEGGAGVSANHGGGGGQNDGGGGIGGGGVSGLSGGGSGAGGGDAGAGASSSPLCEMYPIPARSSWVPTASSHGPNDPVSAINDNMTARWSTGKPQSGDEWVQIDFGKTVAIRSVNLQQGSDPNDYPRMYSVTVSDTKDDLSGPAVFSGEGSSGVSTTTVLSQPHAGRYLLIKQLGVSLSWWSVDELEVGCIDD